MNRAMWAALALVSGAIALGGCASNPKTVNSSVLDVAHSVVLSSVPLAGLPVHAALGKPAVKERGSYRTTSENFCPANGGSLVRAREQFVELCTAKGGTYAGSFCRRAGDGDDVPFMAKLIPTGAGSCMTLIVAEPTSLAAAPGYVAFLASNGYQTAEARRQAAEAHAAESARRAAEAQAAAAAQAARVQARLGVELPRMKKRGTLVCTDDGREAFVGYVEDFTDEKLKVLVTRGHRSQAPSLGIRVEPGTVRWDEFAVWRLCTG